MPGLVSDHGVLAFFCSHFVALALETHPLEPNGGDLAVAPPDGSIGTRTFRIYSGFVIEVRGLWFFVTAGHILHDLEERLARQEERLVCSRLVDFLGSGARNFDPVPFPLLDARRYHTYEPHQGVDFALIHLSDLYRLNLASNGIQPIDNRNWVAEEPLFDLHFIVGLPKELQSRRIGNPRLGQQSFLSIRPTMILVDRLGDAPDPYRSASFEGPQFFGRVQPSEEILESIDGMSGGPIIGVKRNEDGSGTYGVVAIQSSWVETTRVVHGHPFHPLGRMIESELTARTSRSTQPTG